MPRERCSLTPTGASPVSPTLLYSSFEEDMGPGARDEGSLRLADVGQLVRGADVVDVNVKKQRVGAIDGGPGNLYARRKLSKTLLESLLLHEIRALDRLAHLKETALTEKVCCFKTGTIRVRRCVPRREIDGWLVSDGLDAAKVLQSRLVLRNITLQLMEGSQQMGDGSGTPETGASPRSRADALPVRVVPDLPLYLGSGSSAKHAGVLIQYRNWRLPVVLGCSVDSLPSSPSTSRALLRMCMLLWAWAFFLIAFVDKLVLGGPWPGFNLVQMVD